MQQAQSLVRLKHKLKTGVVNIFKKPASNAVCRFSFRHDLLWPRAHVPDLYTKWEERPNLLLCNFNASHNAMRSEARETFRNLAEVRAMPPVSFVNFRKYLEYLRKTKFVLSPPGELQSGFLITFTTMVVSSSLRLFQDGTCYMAQQSLNGTKHKNKIVLNVQ